MQQLRQRYKDPMLVEAPKPSRWRWPLSQRPGLAQPKAASLPCSPPSRLAHGYDRPGDRRDLIQRLLPGHAGRDERVDHVRTEETHLRLGHPAQVLAEEPAREDQHVWTDAKGGKRPKRDQHFRVVLAHHVLWIGRWQAPHSV